ncbi:hypothetical protein Shyhy02_62180 [Streptomyces hygroscopicus subsp. hygroscopicus]|nr:hypothetical protein Shyhy02_62180 [Streptomyces hygroscopicus subsp. hygroscopicus]
MTAPARLHRQGPTRLPAPELVTLIDDPDGPYANSPEGWWTQRGGALDVRSGVVYIPPLLQPAPLAVCRRCRAASNHGLPPPVGPRGQRGRGQVASAVHDPN